MRLKDVTTFIKQYFTKRVLVMGLVVLSAVAVYSTINLRSKLLLTRSELSSSQTLYSIIETEKARLDSLEVVYRRSINTRDSLLVLKDKKLVKQGKDLVILQDSVKKVLADIINVPPDSSYAYVNARVKPTSEQVYPLDSTQIKTVHYTFIERDGLLRINEGLKLYTGNLLQASSIKDNQIVELKSLNFVYLQKESILTRETEAYKIEVEGLNKVVKQQKFLKNILLPPAAIGVGVVIFKILAK